MKITQELYLITVKNNLAIRAYAEKLYDEWQDVTIEELGKGLLKPTYWNNSNVIKSHVISLQLNEKELYFNARRPGALKIPICVLDDPDWKGWLRKKLKRKKDKILINKLSE